MAIFRISLFFTYHSSSLHVPICQECYNVIQEYLKGDSRKNENYVARFIEFFQTQVSASAVKQAATLKFLIVLGW